MKSVNKVLKLLKIPFRFIHRIGSSQLKFVYNKQKKLIEILSPSNIKIVAVKIYKAGKKFIVTIAFIVLITISSGIENQQISKRFYVFSTETPVERVIAVTSGGVINHPWSPGAKYQGKSAKMYSRKTPSVRH
jgi:hypothetical protein